MSIPHSKMIAGAKRSFATIQTIRDQGYPAARAEADRIYSRHAHQIALSMVAACKRADLSGGAYYWANEPITTHGPRAGKQDKMCWGIHLGVERGTGRQAVEYIPLFGGPAKC